MTIIIAVGLVDRKTRKQQREEEVIGGGKQKQSA